MNMNKILLITFVLVCPTATMVAKKNKAPKQPSVAIVGPVSAPNRSVPPPCPVCPNFACTGPTGITGITGCTGPGCTGPCTPDIVSTFCCLNVSQSQTIRGFITVEEALVEGNITVGQNADFKGPLTVGGDGSFSQNVCVQRDLSINNDFTIGGAEIILGTLRANDGAIINGDLVKTGNQTFNGSVIASGTASVGQNLLVEGSATFEGLLTANGNPTGPGPSLIVNNGSIVNGGLIILNANCTAPTGVTNCTGAFIGGNVCFIGDETVAGDLLIGGELTVDKNALFNGGFTSTGNLITNNVTVFNDGLTIAQGNHIINAGNLNLIDEDGLLSVGGPLICGCQSEDAGVSVNFQGTVTMNQGAVINCGLTVEDGQDISVGSLDVTQGDVTVGGNLSVNGSITSDEGQSSFARLTITSTDNALCATGPGALVVNGGVGIAKDVWKGNCVFFANVEDEGGTPGCFNYYEETSYSTSFVWGGQPVTPATNVTVRVVRVGNVVNLLIPEIIIDNPGAHIDVITSATPLPTRFRPTQTVRGASSTIIYNNPSEDPAVVGELGEWNISPAGIITIGLSGDRISPQRILSTDFVRADIDTLTYNINDFKQTCKRCAG